jgi:hypothetical protein
MGSLPPLACAAAAASASALPVASSIRNSAVRTAGAPKRLRRVRFEEARSSSALALSSPPSPLNGLADWSGVWYAASDLVGFRDEARKHCRALRQSLVAVSNDVEDEYSSDSSSGSSSSSSDSSAAAAEPLTLTSLVEDDESHGLEARCCLERQRRKYLTNRCIVRAQKQLSGEQLAMLAQRCTSWAAILAAQEGARDYYRAYKNHPHKTDDDVVVVAATSAKRSASISDDEGDADSRRVRPRLALTV